MLLNWSELIRRLFEIQLKEPHPRRAISERRNVLLREMFHLIRRRQNVGSVLNFDEDEEGDLHVFLDRFNLKKKYVFSIHILRSLIHYICHKTVQKQARYHIFSTVKCIHPLLAELLNSSREAERGPNRMPSPLQVNLFLNEGLYVGMQGSPNGETIPAR